MKLFKVELEDTITDVIAAGPAKSGIAKGNIEVEIIFPSMDFSFLQIFYLKHFYRN